MWQGLRGCCERIGEFLNPPIMEPVSDATDSLALLNEVTIQLVPQVFMAVPFAPVIIKNMKKNALTTT